MKRIELQGRGLRLFAALLLLLATCARHHAAPAVRISLSDTAKVADSTAKAATQPPVKNLSYEQRHGKIVYTKYCSVCHGEEGKGDGFNSFNLNPKPRDFTDAHYMQGLTDDRIIQTITGGGRNVNRSALMPTWGGRLQVQEIKNVAAYLRVFSNP